MNPREPSEDAMSGSPGDGNEGVTRVVLEGCATPQALELLRLELRRLAKSHGAQITNVQIERVEDEIDLLT